MDRKQALRKAQSKRLQMNSSRQAMGALPPHFLKAMRTLFDILDVERTGYIRYEHLARKWTTNPPTSPGIPPGFLDSLRRVTPPNGLLTFERFCAGLRLALAENQHQQPVHRVLSDPNLHRGTRQADRRSYQIFGSQQSVTNDYENHEVVLRQKKLPSKWPAQQTRKAAAPPPSYEHALVRLNHPPKRQAVPPPKTPGATIQGLAEGSKPQKVDAFRFRPISTVSASSGTSSMDHSKSISPEADGYQVQMRDKSRLTAVSDARRHTMGEDAQPRLIRHERLLAEEAELLGRGQDVATRLNNWYSERLTSLEKRQKLLDKGMVPVDTAVHEEKLNYLRAHTTELNRKIVALMECSDKGFPSHFNMELRNKIPQPADDQLAWLKKQNRHLTDEIRGKSDQVEQLEAEKAALIKQVFEQQASANQRRPSSLIRPSAQRPALNGHVTNGNAKPLARTKTYDATLM